MNSTAENGIRSTEVRNLRVLSERFPLFHSVALGLFFKLGSRDETAPEQGITHVVEHMLFKGTTKYSAGQISQVIESLGGAINGFTNREGTGIYTWFLAEHFDLVSELLLEILNESQFAAGELAKEREVIFEEIKSAHEDPEDEVGELLSKAFYGDDAMGRPVGGEIETVGSISDGRLRNYFRENYSRPRAVLAAVGDIDHDRLSRKFDLGLKLRGDGRVERTPPKRQAPNIQLHQRHEISQVFVCLAKPIFGYPDPRRAALSVLNVAFGTATSSRLFLRLREEEGLVYSISSFADLFSDAGSFGVFLVTDRNKLGRALHAVKAEWNRLAAENITAEEFKTARSYTKGMMILGQESLSNRLRRLVQNQMLLGRVVPFDEKVREIDALQRDDLAALLPELGRFEDLYVSAVGPITEKELQELL